MLYQSKDKIKLTIYLFSALISSSIIFNTQPAHANVNDFEFSDFVGDYHLSRDHAGRSTLKVVESFTAKFPDYRQNKGIVRGIPYIYNEHPLTLKLLSVTRNGQSENIYSKEYLNDELIISTGTETYLLGAQHYVFNYTLRDVTKNIYENNDSINQEPIGQEIYWNSIGTNHSQTFQSVQAKLHIDSAISNTLSSNISCYQGGYGSKEPCEIEQVSPELIIFTATRPMQRNENLSFAVAFKSGTFLAYQENFLSQLRIPIYISATILVIISFIWSFISLHKRKNPINYNRPTPTEYIPPKNVSITLSSDTLAIPQAKIISAQIVDLAVKHYIEIIEVKAKGLFSLKKTNYELKLLKTTELLPEETFFIKTLFPGQTIGDVYKLQKADHAVGAALYAKVKTNRNRAIKVKYRQKSPSEFRPLILVLISFISLAIYGLLVKNDPASILPEDYFGIIALIHIALLIQSTAIGAVRYPLTKEGNDLKYHLLGLKRYIKLAETDRIKFLQSPSGAEKIPIDTNDSKQLVRLYEKLLPYAILFNCEKGWTKHLSFYYEDSSNQPDWYHGQSAFNAALFASSINNFSNQLSSQLTPPSSSGGDSGSGSGGGGFSGGGGGGGSFGGR